MRRKKVDDIDLKIIESLRKDGRKKLTEIADELNMTHPSIHERIKKLVSNEIIRIQANLNLSKLRLKAAFVSLKMRDTRDIPKLVEKCSNCSRLLLMGFGSGKYNVFVILIGETFDELRCTIERNFSSRNIEEMIVSYGEIIYPTYLPIQFNSSPSEIINEICSKCSFYQSRICGGCGSFLRNIKEVVIS